MLLTLLRDSAAFLLSPIIPPIYPHYHKRPITLLLFTQANHPHFTRNRYLLPLEYLSICVHDLDPLFGCHAENSNLNISTFFKPVIIIITIKLNVDH